MSTLLSCLDYAFGITTIECSCTEDNRPDDVNISLTGLYLDQIISLKMFNDENCFEGDLWDKIAASKQEALARLKTDIIGCVADNSQLPRKTFKGIIGDWQKVSSRDAQVTTTQAGVKMYFANIAGGTGTLKRIGLALNTAGTYLVEIFNNKDEGAIASYNLNTVANKLTWTDIDDLELLFDVESSYNMEYYIVVTLAGAKPKELKTDCGCGSGWKPNYNEKSPPFNSLTPKGQFEWANYLMITGIQGSDTSTFETGWPTQGKFLNGIALDVLLSCNTETLICNTELDFVSDPIAMTMAWAYRYATAASLVTKIMNDPFPNNFTMLGTEQLQANLSLYNSEYNLRIGYICTQLSKPEHINRSSDCFVCKEKTGLRKSGIYK